ncbi:hypothetical protein Droror1_Dr00023592 [Drosera rotundifolia]
MRRLPSRYSATLLPLLSLLLLHTSLVPSASLSLADRSVLLDLNRQWGDPPALSHWTNTTKTTDNPCSWTGVECSSDNATVTGLLLSNLNITYQIPPSICNLTSLTTLNLSWNYVPGGFPSTLFRCRSLRVLDLSENYFTGQLPIDIGNLSGTLQVLDLTGNNFSGDVPKSIGELTDLRILRLTLNLFNGTFPSEIGDSLMLEELGLAYNGFMGMEIPDSFGGLRNLKVMYMRQCGLIGRIPVSFVNLTSIERLDLMRNDLVGEIPSGLLQFTNLSYLYLFENRLSSEIPSSIGCFGLVEIDLSSNNLTGPIPVGFEGLRQLRTLNLFSNQLSGEIPTRLGLLPKLVNFNIWSNNLSGVIPPELGLHSNLRAFQVSMNRFSGPFPENLCANGQLTGVIAFKNNLTGGIPSSLTSCQTLRAIELYDNELSGEVPSGVWTLENLELLMLSDNVFEGKLPDEISWNMSLLEIANNNFSGEIPSKVGNWSNLMVFLASNNSFSGTIPPEITRLSRINTLSLDGNGLSGEIPGNIDSWQFLTTLNLARNRLSGSIPSALGSLLDLIDLDLSDNDLSGEIPAEIGSLKLTFLNLSSNKLTGEIPSSLSNLAFENSFLNNSKLCTANQIRTLPTCSSLHSSKSLSSRLLALILVIAVALFMVTLFLTLNMAKEYRNRKQRSELKTWKLTSFQKLDFTEATILSSLTDDNVIGTGGSGKVYRIAKNRLGDAVAVKKIWNKKQIDEAQFIAEVQILGTIKHSNIVKLLCCISSDQCKLLVYEYMENQSLDKWLHGSDAILDWPTRSRIAVGAAQGLCYMHHDCSPPVVHRDVKSSNILLDSSFNPKIADFGLAKQFVKRGQAHTVTAVAGSFGYLAPEYGYMSKVNEKIDVYSFGVVLLELTTGKEPTNAGDNLNLADWAWKHYSNGNQSAEILDKQVKQPHFLEEMSNVLKLGLMCTATLPSSRPSMKEVLQVLRRCSSLEECGIPKTANEHDHAPLIGSERCKSTHRNSKKVAQDDDFSSMA